MPVIVNLQHSLIQVNALDSYVPVVRQRVGLRKPHKEKSGPSEGRPKRSCFRAPGANALKGVQGCDSRDSRGWNRMASASPAFLASGHARSDIAIRSEAQAADRCDPCSVLTRGSGTSSSTDQDSSPSTSS